MYIFNTPIYNYPTLEIHICIYQCLESESVESARFWLPGSGSRAKYQPNFLHSEPKSEARI